MPESESGGPEVLHGISWWDDDVVCVRLGDVDSVGSNIEEAIHDWIANYVMHMTKNAPEGEWALVFDRTVEAVIMCPSHREDMGEEAGVGIPQRCDLELPRYATDQEVMIIKASRRQAIDADDPTPWKMGNYLARI